MEIRCPACSRALDTGETADDIVCPHCGRTLEVALSDEGFALIGAREEAPVEDAPPVPLDDPIMEDYTQWRGRAVFIMLFGAVGALVVALSVTRGLLESGVHYFHIGKNQFFIGALGMVSLILLLAGAWLFRYLGRERERYVKQVMGDG